MPTILPFQPLRYNPARIPDPGAVIAPPYDVINDEKRSALLQRDPHNVIRLILPVGPDDARYDEAGELFRRWIDEEILIREPESSLYAYRQTFALPGSGHMVDRLGFIARVGLAPFDAGQVLPHERTLSGPKQDRLKLMVATEANLEPIFGIYRDDDAHSRRMLIEATDGRPPLVTAIDSEGVTHTLWRIETAEFAELTEDLRSNPIFIVDGHHRYETALNYQRLRRESGNSAPGEALYDSIMMFLAPMSDPGLVILPTHRIVHSLSGFDFEAFLQQLGDSFDVHDLASPEEGLAMLASHVDRPSYLLCSGAQYALVTLRAGVDPVAIVGDGLPKAVRRLDVTILHEGMLERLLGISREAQERQTNIRYVKSDREALDAAALPGVQMAVLLNPTRLEQVIEVAGSGEVMPQKSTYFYPKLASGLVMNPLW